MINKEGLLLENDIKEYLKIGNDKLYDFILKDKRINKFRLANRYYIDLDSFLFFLKGTRRIDFSKAFEDAITKDNLPRFVDTKEFSELLGISQNTAYKYIKDDDTFPATKIGQKYYVWIDLVPLWLNKKKGSF